MSRFHNRRHGGFTLIEVLLVLVILVILASFAVVSIGPVQRRAHINQAKVQVALFSEALKMYEFNVGSYPTTLDALRHPPGDLPNPSRWEGPYLDKDIPPDPWNNAYQYTAPGTHNPDSFDVWSLGPDGVSGTEDDIGNWTQQEQRR
ncbi:MAG: type II secretion system major pseudopilin GspG [Thermoguttaceae bacterium]|jgi:general secretion pathway protein G